MSKTDYVHGHLREQIIGGELTAGYPLRQEEIATQLGVSQTPVREALWRLRSEGLVEYHAHRGATVTDLSGGAVEELYLLRAEVEGLTARLAAERADGDALARLRERHDAMVTGIDQWNAADLAVASRELHAEIAEIGGPAFLAGHIRWLWANYPVPSNESMWRDPDSARYFLQAHERVLDALSRGDGETAERLMADHIRHAAQARQRHGTS